MNSAPPKVIWLRVGNITRALASLQGREYAVYREGAGMIGINATGVRLCDLKLRRLERFVYEYDFGDSWIHDLRLEATLPINASKVYPMCAAGKCSAPPEDCGGAYAFMANRGRVTGSWRCAMRRTLLLNAETAAICSSVSNRFVCNCAGRST